MIRALVDSDVILDYVLHREHFSEAEPLFNALADIDFTGYVSAIALLNVHYFAEKEVDRTFAQEEVIKLLSLFSVCTIDESCFHKALSLKFGDYEDAVQCASAIAEDLDAIVTRNTKDYINSPMPVYSPVEFVQIMQDRSVA